MQLHLGDEPVALVALRWKKLYKGVFCFLLRNSTLLSYLFLVEFYDSERDRFDITKLSDIYVAVKNDVLHNATLEDIGVYVDF